MIFLLGNNSFAATDYEKAAIRILNKITAKSFLVDIDLKKDHKYGGLNIKIHKCWNAPLEQKPETKMLLEINENEQNIFFGWLFASSPSISSLEHPIYDITAIKCK